VSPPVLLRLAPADAADPPRPTLVELLVSAGRYVQRYEDAFRLVVAEEVYVQRRRLSAFGPVRQTRQLVSDVAFVRAPGTSIRWWLLRDVYEVDGSPVRDREARLERLLVDGPAGVLRARAIADEDARFNLGRGYRNFNVPTIVLAFLHPSLQPRFSFKRKGHATIEGRPFVELEFQELGAPTIVRGPASQPDVLSSGRVWVEDDATGTVGRTELELQVAAGGVEARARLETKYRPHAALGLWVPVEMRERWQREPTGRAGPSAGEVVEGFAAYSAFRQAGVSTKEEFRLPEPGQQ
jgi:hypothetical protein